MPSPRPTGERLHPGPSSPVPPVPTVAPPPPAGAPAAAFDVAVPPGWYPDGVGWRWWDGRTWGPPAPPQVDSSDTGLAVFSHLGFLVGGFILPLVLYVISNDEQRPETRYHAREALNFQLTVMIVQVGATVLATVGLIATGAFELAIEPSDDIGAVGASFGAFFGAFFLVFGLIFVLVIGSIVLAIIGAVKAGRGERYRYPLCIRLVRS